MNRLKQTTEPQISFDNPNTPEETAKRLIQLIASALIERVAKNKKGQRAARTKDGKTGAPCLESPEDGEL